MARIVLSAEERQQLDEWLNGGPTDPTGLVAWLADPANADAPAATRTQAEGERDLYQLLLAKDGSNIRSQDLTQKMRDALLWVATSLNEAEAAGLPIPLHQDRMRRLWNWVQANL